MARELVVDVAGVRRGTIVRTVAAMLCGALLVVLSVPASADERDDDRPAEATSAHLPLTDLLPPLDGGMRAPDRVARCGADGVRCLREVERNLAGWEAHFGCDHRAVFPTVYRLLTREARLAIEHGSLVLDDPAGFGFEALLFLDLFQRMHVADAAGERVPAAWQVSLDVAAAGDHTALSDMLLAINAHVQRDMPFAVADTGLVVPDGRSRKPDHDAFNAVLHRAYRPIVREVAARYDPLLAFADGADPVDTLAANALIQVWREGVWRNAERLGTARQGPLRGLTVLTIEQQAYLSALALTQPELPGHRAQRLAHCEAAAVARGEASPRPGPPDAPPLVAARG